MAAQLVHHAPGDRDGHQQRIEFNPRARQLGHDDTSICVTELAPSSTAAVPAGSEHPSLVPVAPAGQAAAVYANPPHLASKPWPQIWYS
jgi:hypothetical protein